MGHKYLSHSVKKELRRNSKKQTRSYSSCTVSEYRSLVESFTKDDYELYEKCLRAWGGPGRKKEFLLEKLDSKGIIGPVRDIAEIRVSDLIIHQKVKQMIRWRWTDTSEYKKQRLNKQIKVDPDRFWKDMGKRVLSKQVRELKKVNQYWTDERGFDRLVSFLKELYKSQNGKCAVTGLPMELDIGNKNENKCSLDRINSNRGYFPGNVHLTVWWVNRMKFDLSQDDFYKKVNIIYNYQNKENKNDID